MTDNTLTLEEEFIENTTGLSSVYLTNGIKLVGEIIDNDEKNITLERNGELQLIYKHAISTVS